MNSSTTTTSLDLLKTIPVCQDHPELGLEVLQAILEISKSSSLIQIKDWSIGTDQTVFYINTDTSFEAIIKVPKSAYREKDDSGFSPMHLPNKQAWLLKTLENQKDVLCPRLLYLDPNNKFLIETFLPEANLNEIVNQISEDELHLIMNDLGSTMKGLHSIKSKKFGYISLDDDNHGRFDNWLEMFQDYHGSLQKCTEVINIDEETIQKIKDIYNEQKDYLSSFNKSCLLHADLSFNNMRARKDNDGKWSFSGIIDFADVLSGDPLFDFGEFLGDRGGDWKVISFMEETYLGGGRFSTSERKLIRFYALYFCLCWLTGSTGERLTIKTNTLYTLLNMKFD